MILFDYKIREGEYMRKGFTLAEVLITLSIIGVVAALTAPALTKNSGQAKIGPSLAKFVNTFETAGGLMMQEQSLTRFVDADAGESISSLPMEELANNMLMAPTTEAYNYYPPNGGTATTIAAGSAYVLKDGSIMGVLPYATVTNLGDKGAYKGTIADIIYDINGNAGKNRAGKDVFMFVLDNSGTLVPYGSNTYKYLYPSFKTACDADGSTLAAGLACTGAIADNSWKVDY